MYSATNLRTWYATTSDFPVVFIADASMDTLNLARDVAHALPSTVLCTSAAIRKKAYYIGYNINLSLVRLLFPAKIFEPDFRVVALF